MSKFGILIDYEYCTGCHSCEFACRQENNLPLGQWGIKVFQIGPWKINNNKWQYGYIAVPTDQCTYCGKRLAQGKIPSCVQHCQASVLQFGTIEELSKLLKQKSKQILFVPK